MEIPLDKVRSRNLKISAELSVVKDNEVLILMKARQKKEEYLALFSKKDGHPQLLSKNKEIPNFILEKMEKEFLRLI